MTRSIASLSALLVVVVLAACQNGGPPGPPDLVLHGGTVITLDEASSEVRALAVRDGRVVAVGSDDAVLERAGPETERIDLEGRTVIPGLGDNHFHALGGGPGVDLSGARSIADVVEAIRARAEETATGELIRTNSDWHEGQLAEARLPLRDDLDRAAPDHPVVVVRGGHELILNSAALDRFGIDRSTPEPEGGRIGRYDDGRLNGELVDRAKALADLPPRPRPSREERRRALRDEHRTMNALGVTDLRYPGGSIEQYRLLEEMARDGELSLRVDFLLRLPAGAPPERLDSLLTSWDVEPRQGDDRLRIGGIKLGVDGGFEGGLMRDPYEEPWGEGGTYHGLQTVPYEPFERTVRHLNRRGWRVATHAVGDSAIDLVLRAYEAADAERTIADRRWTVEHAFIGRPDHLPRLRELGVSLSVQDHLYVAGPSLVDYWGPKRAARTTPVREYLDAGLRVSSGTDSPVIPYNPFWTLYHFTTRNTLSAGVLGPEQAVTVEEALRMATAGYAHLAMDEADDGTLEVGKRADLAVIDVNPLSATPEALRDASAWLTMVDGEVVWRASAAP